jgi:uncharacterized delta-60 repeat protein
VVLQGDGQILVGGNFTAINGASRTRVARLNKADGAPDGSFTTSSGGAAGGYVKSVAIQGDNKILIGGYFTTYNATSRGHFARLNTDGTLDTSFLATGVGADATVTAVAVQSDGKILIGGGFSNYNGVGRGQIARVNSDGTVDSAFPNAAAGANSMVYSIVQQGDGRILIGGGFSSYNSASRSCIARLNADGGLDPSFLVTSTGANSIVYSLAQQSDGLVLIGGNFTAYNYSTARGHIARLLN